MTIRTFHNGELELQKHTGMREKIDRLAQRLMLDYMPDEHRSFFEGLEYILMGIVDESGHPKACILTGKTGFISSPNAKTLVITTGKRSINSVFSGLCMGQPVGVLGIDFSNRRRNRMHGRVSAMDDNSITISVVQSYGNCPKYISLREVSRRKAQHEKSAVFEHIELDNEDSELIARADTFFIASYMQDASGAPYEGADISHRGGRPGFVLVDNPSQITIPDYTGNFLFNTLGNLLLHPRAGLLFLNFQTGDQLHIDGETLVINDAAIVTRFPGAQRLLQVKIQRVSRQNGATSLRWHLVEASPFSPDIKRKKE